MIQLVDFICILVVACLTCVKKPQVICICNYFLRGHLRALPDLIAPHRVVSITAIGKPI